MVSIAAFQAVDPASIPGQRINFGPKIMFIFIHFLFATNVDGTRTTSTRVNTAKQRQM